MVRTTFGVALLALLAGRLAAAERPALPSGPQPHQALARLDEDGNLHLREVISDHSVRQQLQIGPAGDGSRVRQHQEVVSNFRVDERTVDPKDVQAFDTAGKKVAPDDLAGRLKKETPVLVSADGKKVDPFYLLLIKKGTLVLVLPQAEPAAPAPEKAQAGTINRENYDKVQQGMKEDQVYKVLGPPTLVHEGFGGPTGKALHYTSAGFAGIITLRDGVVVGKNPP